MTKWKKQKVKSSERVSESRGVRETAEASGEQLKTARYSYATRKILILVYVHIYYDSNSNSSSRAYIAKVLSSKAELEEAVG